jgi:hypothetical protein
MTTRDELIKQILERSSESAEPKQWNLKSPKIIRCPWLWIGFFETRGIKREDIITVDGAEGELTRSFRVCSTRVYSLCVEAPYTVDATTTSQIERLVTHFEAAGKLFCQVPLPSPQTSGTAIANAARPTQAYVHTWLKTPHPVRFVK